MSHDRSNASGRSRGYRHGELVVGRLEEHGAAPYQFQRDQGLSYYVKIITNSGPRTLWGTDLARAIAQSVTKAKIGNVVGVRSTGADAVHLPGGPPGSAAPERIVRRNRWMVEQVRFFGDRARERFDDELVVGRLKDHGQAPYELRQEEADSYYIKVLTTRGEKMLWGKDLARAISASATQVTTGDVIGARRTGVEAFVVGDRTVRRYSWIVERVEFFAKHARQARRLRDDHNDARAAIAARPELKSGFLTMRAAREFAEHAISNAEDRERFLRGVQSAIDGSILKGTPLPSVRMQENPTKSPPAAKPPGRDRSRTR